MESKLNIISSDVIFLAGCTADPQASNEATVHMLLVRAAHHYTESHHSSARYCIHKASHSYPRRTRFTSPSRSCFLIPTCWGITQALLPPMLAHQSRDLLHWATQESEAATSPTMTCNNAIAKHTAMSLSLSSHANNFLCVYLALSLALTKTICTLRCIYCCGNVTRTLRGAGGERSVRYLLSIDCRAACRPRLLSAAMFRHHHPSSVGGGTSRTRGMVRLAHLHSQLQFAEDRGCARYGLVTGSGRARTVGSKGPFGSGSADKRLYM